MKKNLRTIIVVLGVVILGMAGWHLMSGHKHMNHMGQSYDLPMADFGLLEDFSLTNQDGKTISRADLIGNPWVANFIFTRCTGPCPVMSSHMSQLTTEFPNANLKFVSFSVDPQYDTPEILRAYAKRYQWDQNRWFFLTGDSDKVHEIILKGFKLALEENIDPNISIGEKINHSLHFVLVDEVGHVRGYYNGYDVDARDRLRENLKTLLGSHGKPASPHN